MAPEIHLAGELIEHIVSFLLDDRRSIQFCSLVSHHWCSAAQPAVFHSLKVEEKMPPPQWRSKRAKKAAKKKSKKRKGGRGVKEEDDEEEAPPDEPEKFDLIKRITPPFDVGRYVKSLEIKCQAVTPSEIARVLELFPTLQRLALSANLLADNTPPSLSPPRPLAELRLTDFTFAMDDWSPVAKEDAERSKDQPAKCSLVQFLNLFGEIGTFYTRDIYPIGGVVQGWGDGGAGYDACRCCRPLYPQDKEQRSAIRAEGMKISEHFSVKRIVTSDTDYTNDQRGQEVVLDLLVAAPRALSTVQELDIDEHLLITRDLLTATGPQLSRLHLNVTSTIKHIEEEDRIDNDPSQTGISFCGQRLSFAHVGLHHNFAMNTLDDYWKNWLFTFESAIMSLPPTLPRLVIEFHCGKLMPDNFDWKKMDSTFAERDLTELELVFDLGAHLLKKDERQFYNGVRKWVPQLWTKLGERLKVRITEYRGKRYE
ncbi:hypothetical protein BXZ70DRAFT_768370 [Cristinia sonorae]|uniref:F-box domain-containing protein n=1 Tax=Cristinia sonorae TaxID=1940300 RepID=A0A8K0UTS3_9AGAR|nr:hypothetical protein BXZ70DRAFT_768370 [Cristinia sonorae]